MSFKRNLLPTQLGGPSKGIDVKAVKAGIARAGYWQWAEFNDLYTNEFAFGDSGMGAGVAGYQRGRKLKVATFGKFDLVTYKDLLKVLVPKGLPHAGERAFSLYYQQQYDSFELDSPAELIMKKLYAICADLVRHESSVHYTMTRPQEEITWNAIDYPIEFDCSSSVIAVAKWAGVRRSPDPVCQYTGFGNTETLVQGGFAIKREDIMKYVKDNLVLAFWHGARTNHVGIVKSLTEVFSHGEEEGPVWQNSIDYRGAPFAIRAYPVT